MAYLEVGTIGTYRLGTLGGMTLACTLVHLQFDQIVFDSLLCMGHDTISQDLVARLSSHGCSLDPSLGLRASPFWALLCRVGAVHPPYGQQVLGK